MRLGTRRALSASNTPGTSNTAGGKAPRTARSRPQGGRVIAKFKQVVRGGELRMHPIVGRLVEKVVLEKLEARK